MRKDGVPPDEALPSGPCSVGSMFDRIAPTYDLLNHLLSAGRDDSWRRRVARQIRNRENLEIIDLATGTGDLLLSLLRGCPNTVKATGLDISERMLAICREKLQARGLEQRVDLICGDVLATPFSAGAFDLVTMAFGIRNTADVAASLAEIHRLLKPGGMALILEFSLPASRLVRWCYLKYLRSVVPWIGRVVSGDGHAYRYLNESIEGFYRPEAFCGLLRRAGFQGVSVTPLTFGVASIYKGTK